MALPSGGNYPYHKRCVSGALELKQKHKTFLLRNVEM